MATYNFLIEERADSAPDGAAPYSFSPEDRETIYELARNVYEGQFGDRINIRQDDNNPIAYVDLSNSRAGREVLDELKEVLSHYPEGWFDHPSEVTTEWEYAFDTLCSGYDVISESPAYEAHEQREDLEARKAYDEQYPKLQMSDTNDVGRPWYLKISNGIEPYVRKEFLMNHTDNRPEEFNAARDKLLDTRAAGNAFDGEQAVYDTLLKASVEYRAEHGYPEINVRYVDYSLDKGEVYYTYDEYKITGTPFKNDQPIRMELDRPEMASYVPGEPPQIASEEIIKNDTEKGGDEMKNNDASTENNDVYPSLSFDFSNLFDESTSEELEAKDDMNNITLNFDPISNNSDMSDTVQNSEYSISENEDNVFELTFEPNLTEETQNEISAEEGTSTVEEIVAQLSEVFEFAFADEPEVVGYIQDCINHDDTITDKEALENLKNQISDYYGLDKEKIEVDEKDTIDFSTENRIENVDTSSQSNNTNKHTEWLEKDRGTIRLPNDTFRMYHKMGETYNACKNGIEVNGKVPTKIDVVVSAINFWKSNILESLIIGALRVAFDVEKKPNDVENSGTDKNNTDADIKTNDVGFGARDISGVADNGHIDKSGTSDKVTIDSEQRTYAKMFSSEAGKFYGADMTKAPDRFSTKECVIYSTNADKVDGRGVIRVDSDSAQKVTFPDIRMVELNDNRMLVDPFGRILDINERFSKSPDFNGNNGYLQGLDVSQGKAGAFIEKEASLRGISPESFKEEISNEAISRFCDRVESTYREEASTLNNQAGLMKNIASEYDKNCTILDKFGKICDQMGYDKLAKVCDSAKSEYMSARDNILKDVEPISTRVAQLNARADAVEAAKAEGRTVSLDERFQTAVTSEKEAVGRQFSRENPYESVNKFSGLVDTSIEKIGGMTEIVSDLRRDQVGNDTKRVDFDASTGEFRDAVGFTDGGKLSEVTQRDIQEKGLDLKETIISQDRPEYTPDDIRSMSDIELRETFFSESNIDIKTLTEDYKEAQAEGRVEGQLVENENELVEKYGETHDFENSDIERDSRFEDIDDRNSIEINESEKDTELSEDTAEKAIETQTEENQDIEQLNLQDSQISNEEPSIEHLSADEDDSDVIDENDVSIEDDLVEVPDDNQTENNDVDGVSNEERQPETDASNKEFELDDDYDALDIKSAATGDANNVKEEVTKQFSDLFTSEEKDAFDVFDGSSNDESILDAFLSPIENTVEFIFDLIDAESPKEVINIISEAFIDAVKAEFQPLITIGEIIGNSSIGQQIGETGSEILHCVMDKLNELFGPETADMFVEAVASSGNEAVFETSAIDGEVGQALYEALNSALDGTLSAPTNESIEIVADGYSIDNDGLFDAISGDEILSADADTLSSIVDQVDNSATEQFLEIKPDLSDIDTEPTEFIPDVELTDDNVDVTEDVDPDLIDPDIFTVSGAEGAEAFV